MFVRTATPEDTLEIRRILDGAMLEPGDVESRIDAGDVFVAGDQQGGTATTGGDSGASADGRDGTERILGTVVIEPLGVKSGSHVGAIGVRRRHRGRGIGRALIEAALEREGRLTARFDDGVRPFYDRLGFSIEPIDEQRYSGVVIATDGV